MVYISSLQVLDVYHWVTERQRDLIEFQIHISYFMIHTISFTIHSVKSPQLHIIWHEDGPVQGSKHVISLNKATKDSCVFDSKEPLIN